MNEITRGEVRGRLISGLASYYRSLSSIDAYIEHIRGSSSIITFQPPMESGGFATLPDAVERRIVASAVSELEKCRREIVGHIARIESLID
jgi:hypothetical protein